MEGELSAQVVAPMLPIPSHFLHTTTLAKKRDSPWQNPKLHPNPNKDWDPAQFQWDRVRFSAKPLSNGVEISKGVILPKNSEDGGNLTLRLGGGAQVPVEEPAVGRPSKKVRSGSPGSTGSGGRAGPGGGSYPMCQVDNCRADLLNGKDYHRRHKVCEIHSKATEALVGMDLQRFCQQCSRFHPLAEFDEMKRSCRRRLAGHNRRRRKTQPEDGSYRLFPTGNQENNVDENSNVAELLGLLASVQGTAADKVSGVSLIPDKDNVIQILREIGSLPTENYPSRSPLPKSFDLNVSQDPQYASSEQPNEAKGYPSTVNLFAALSSALAVSSPECRAALSQISSYNCAKEKAKITYAELVGNNNAHYISKHPPGASLNSCTQSQLELAKYPVQEAPSCLPLQLFSSPEDDRHPKTDSMRKYVSSESSNPMEDRTPSSSSRPPAVMKFFPLKSVEHDGISICHEDRAPITSTSHGLVTPLDLFKKSDRRVGNVGLHNFPGRAGYASSTSDHSPSTSNSDVQDRTERIIFKLFDKHPSNFPRTLRSQIFNWLSNSPSEMESYIRPGCVVLSIYASMPSDMWSKLEHNLHQRVSSLVQCSESEFWRSGRFLVRTNRQLACYKDGKIRLCKSWRTGSAPELTLVSPVALVSGEETTLVLRGCNLTVPGTKIHCTFMGSYISKEVLVPAYPGTSYDTCSVESFSFNGGPCNVFGRLFIEVENGFKGNSFPVIIADAAICQELRVLEVEFGEVKGSADGSTNQVGARSREDVLHFLNELGWLFQRKDRSLHPINTDFSSSRFNFLFTFSVERDWLAVVRTLIDILVQRNLKGDDSQPSEIMEMLVESQLLSKAVKRKFRKMVDLLLHYSVESKTDDSKTYLFPPNSTDPNGVTPLHLAASTQYAEDIVDALTNDPQEIGLTCWSSVTDNDGQSPHAYAAARNNHSYNALVARKLADRKNDQISVIISDQDLPNTHPVEVRPCARCASMETPRFKSSFRTRGLLHRPYLNPVLAIAAVCVCVCIFLRGGPQMNSKVPIIWENLHYGST